MKNEEEQDFEKGIFKVACPCCGTKIYHALYEVDEFFGCPFCHEFSRLRYKYLDREKRIVYGLELVHEME
jgi:hypothetical protein